MLLQRGPDYRTVSGSDRMQALNRGLPSGEIVEQLEHRIGTLPLTVLYNSPTLQ
jgi:hypothetical protein